MSVFSLNVKRTSSGYSVILGQVKTLDTKVNKYISPNDKLL